MRFSQVFVRVSFLPTIFLTTILLSSTASAEIKIKVVDPQDAVVSGAEVQLLEVARPAALAVQSTSAEGLAIFAQAPSNAYRIQVLAPGFAPETWDLSATADSITIKLRVATAAETVVVTATRTPVPSQAAGAEVDTLSSQQLQVMQPVDADDAMRFLPGAVVNSAGQRGGISSLFVRGGESTYNKVIVDGVAVDNPGETFDFGTLPLAQADRVEFVRGAQSTLYGSDAMTSVVQVWTRTGSTPIPELRFGADGGNFGTANGYASLAGADGRFDYNFFGDEFNSNGQGVNDAYSESLEGANVGAAITRQVGLRVHFRHSNSYTGVPGEWDFNGDPLLAPDPSEWSHQNNILGSAELTVAAPSGWQHRFTGFDSLYRYTDVNLNSNPASYDDYPDTYDTHVNRVGLEYQGDYSERIWAHSTFGYRVENETGVVNDLDFPPPAPGQRLDQDAYVQQQFTLGRLSAIAGGRFVHSSAYGNTGVPRVALTLLALRGGSIFSGTRLRFSYATGFMEPALYETFGDVGYYYAPNHGLLPERTRAFEAGFDQKFFAGRWALDATYFNNLFHDQIEAIPTPSGEYQFFNLEQSFAHGAEVELQGRIRSKLSLTTAYTYTSTEILENPQCTPANPCSYPYAPGDPLQRRPKHSATTLLSYLGTRWGANVAGSFVGRRPDDAFLYTPNDFYHAAGYARVDLGGWYAINSRIAAYADVGNAFNDHYNEVVGYPALTANFRAGLRFRIGGE
ncbi:MAG: TonB-dependent receptor domain-containing protein [Terriglobales bacterium]